ncbi:MAG: YraN family protein, partial [Planctomycetota bacterium]
MLPSRRRAPEARAGAGSARAGQKGEELTASLLAAQGFRIEGRNVRTTFGEIDLLVLHQSIAALAQLPAGLCLGANLGADTLRQAGLGERVGEWLAQAGVAPQRLHLEITETALLNLEAPVTATIQGLAALGVRWMVDDFGTGFSSISHLRDLPIHGLKLDRSFCEGLRHG